MADRASQKPSGRGLPLRLHIAGLFAAILLIVTLALGFVVGRSSQDLVDRAVTSSFLGAADLALLDLRRLDQTARAAAEALAVHPIVSTLTREERVDSLHMLATLLRAEPSLAAAYVGWPDGEFVLLRPMATAGEQPNPPEGAVWLAQWSGGVGARFDFLDESLATLESRSDVDYAFDPRVRPWYREALQAQGTIVTEPYVFFTNHEPGITAARRAESGAVVGVDISLWELSARLPRERPTPSTEVAVLDAGGGVLAYGRIERLQALLSQMAGEQPTTSGEGLPAVAALEVPVLGALGARAKTAESFIGSLEAGGHEWIATVVPLGERGLYFAMAAPLDELGVGPRAIRDGLLITLGLAALLALPVIWTVGRLIARPVEEFVGEVERIGRLDFTAPPPVRSRVAELVTLDRSIGRMRGALDERLRELDCLYQVLRLTADGSRPVEEICAEIARLLPRSFTGEQGLVGRVVLGGREFRSDPWAEPVASWSVPIAGTRQDGGRVELGRLSDAPAAGPAGDEPPPLLSGIASHIERMLQARELAARLSQSERLGAVGQLTGGIAHDFNNLLTVILGNAELLVEQLAGQPKQQALAEMAATAADRCSELTRRLLVFARQQSLAPRLVAIDALIAAMDPLLRRTLSESIDIRVVADPALWLAEVDPVQLEAAMLNLAINARDAMPEGGCLTIEAANVTLEDAVTVARLQLEPGDYVMVSVTDTGVGMSEDVLQHAFEPFFTTKEVGKGSGLGLSMVYGFVRQSRGQIRIYSEAGQGTTIRLYFPRAAAASAEAAEEPPPPTIPRGSEQILVVEDDELVRGHLLNLLADLGYRARSASTGAEALRLLEQEPGTALLFTDLVLPGGMNGLQLASAASARWPGLRVLFASGYAENALQHQGRLMPQGALVAKPYRRIDLAIKLRRVLDAPPAGGPADRR